MLQEFTGAGESAKDVAVLNLYRIVSEIAVNHGKPVPAPPGLLSLPGGRAAGWRSADRS
ncbi:hypothetical protein AB0J35_60245 [Nonomuraea angiospora]|uniref:hypothetical protein n=1 Tax=Nonomuraea angiospora TaxID=46172 RepID=UPI003447E74C